MSTQALMIASALFMAVLGIGASFFPQEIMAALGSSVDEGAVITVKIAGALYLGFAMLNWTARHNLIGGIYSRPVAVGNLVHFVVAAIVLLRASFMFPGAPVILTGAAAYFLFAAWFSLVVFTHPGKEGG